MKFGSRAYRAAAVAAMGLILFGGTLKATGKGDDAAAAKTDTTSATTDVATMGPEGKVYSLHMYHLHTGESIDVVYRIGNKYIPQALDQLNHFLRDHRTQDASHYDPREFDLLHSIMTKLGRPDGIIDIVCGYRTPWSNAYLRHGSASSGVAEHSQHMEAKAIDIRVPGVQTARLRDTAESFQAGGVGYYPVSQFVHVDVGPVRTWSFGESTAHARVQTATLHHRARSHAVVHHAGD